MLRAKSDGRLRVLALTKYDAHGASSRVRTFQFLGPLAERNISIEPAPLLARRYLETIYGGEARSVVDIVWRYVDRVRHLIAGGGYDVLWIEKEALPYIPAALETLLISRRTPLVVDLDDAIFHNYDRHRNALVRLGLGRKLDVIMRRASAVVAGNAYLAGRAIAAGARRVEIVPSVIDLSRYGERVVPEQESSTFTVGWMGSPGSEAFLSYARDALAEVARWPDVRVVLVGATDRALAGIPHETRKWSLETEVSMLRQFSVGIMPLANTSFQKGKCGYKLIQYMGVGRPVVASPVGVNRQIVRDGENGFLARSTDEWLRAFQALLDRDERVRMGEIGRRIVEANYSTELVVPRLAEIIRGVARDPEA